MKEPVQDELPLDPKVREIMNCSDRDVLVARRDNMLRCLAFPSGFDLDKISRWIRAIDDRLNKEDF